MCRFQREERIRRRSMWRPLQPELAVPSLVQPLRSCAQRERIEETSDHVGDGGSSCARADIDGAAAAAGTGWKPSQSRLLSRAAG
jgi:hypothetical protein